ncbi:MAG: 30S ribosomal protein S17, partial [Chloroflexi bacterium]|nr:30S ribosomal protein S17 [Chloroflexota bacterium]
MNERAALRKSRVGRVVSDVMDKTVVVVVERRVHHPIYHKSVRHVKKFKAHDERNEFKVGDVVRLMETRPLSRTKRWRVAELLHREEVAEAQQVEATAEVEEELEATAVDDATTVAEVEEAGAG